MLAQRCSKLRESLLRRPLAYPYPVLCDETRATIRQYGVWHPLGLDAFNQAHPACFLIDAPTRRILYAFVGHSQFSRAPLAAILDAAETE